MNKTHDWFYVVHFRHVNDTEWYKSANLYRSVEQFIALNGGAECYAETLLGAGIIVYYGQ